MPGGSRKIDLSEAMCLAPLTHLMPKQDLAPLISSTSVGVDMDDLVISKTEEAAVVHESMGAINKDPETHKDTIGSLANEFKEFQDEDLENISFKKPIWFSSDPNPQRSAMDDLHGLEKKIFEDTPNIDSSSLKELQLTFDPSDFDGSRLSVRKQYDLKDEAGIQRHNTLYRQKFLKEFTMMSSGFQRKAQIDHREANIASAGYDKKRISKDIEESSRLKVQKVVNFTENDLNDSAVDNLIALLTNIEQNEEDPDPAFFDEKSGLLNLGTMYNIHSYLLRIYNRPIIEKIEVDSLLKIESLSYAILQLSTDCEWNKIITSLVEVPENPGLSPVLLEFFNNLSMCLLASKIIAYLLNGHIKGKRLHIDEYLKGVIDFVYSLCQDFVFALASQKGGDQAMAAYRNDFSTILSEVGNLLEMISDYIFINDVDEHTLTRLEYLSIFIIFVEIDPKDKFFVGNSALERLKVNACKVLLRIYKSKPDQRNFILHELITCFDKIPHQKTLARQHKLARGGSIQLITAFLISIVQNYDVNLSPTDIDDSMSKPYGNNDLVLSNTRKVVRRKFESTYTEIKNVCEHIASLLLQELSNNPNQQHKQILELFLDDLLLLLPYPEWPGSVPLVTSMMSSLLSLIQSGTSSSFVETYAIEMVGNIAAKILDLRGGEKDLLSLSTSSSVEEIVSFRNSVEDLLEFVQLHSSWGPPNVNSFRFLLLKYIHYTSPLIAALTETDTENTHADQLGALKSDSDGPNDNSIVQSLNDFYDYLLNAASEDFVKVNSALQSNKDSSSVRSYISTFLSQDLLPQYEMLLNILIKNLDSNKIKLRTKCVKILSTFVEKDRTLLLSPNISEPISKRLLDSSPLVRDAVIDLISKYMSSSPEIIENFHSAIGERLNDESVQVRKRVMKLFKDMYVHSVKRSTKSQIAIKILRRMDDEDDVIQQLAVSYLKDLWFYSLTFEIGENNDSSVVVFKRVEVMMEVVSSNKVNSGYFENFMVENVLNSTEESLQSATKLIIDSSLNIVVDSGDLNDKKSEKALEMISLLVRCKGTLLSQDQIITLQPCIIDEDQAVKPTCFYSLAILRNTLPHVVSLRPDFLNSIQSSLLRRLSKFTVRELHEAMPCAWRLCEIKKNTVKMASASISCIKMIRPYLGFPKSESASKPDAKLARLLHLLGCFGTYCNLERHRDIFLKSAIGLKDKENVSSIVVKFLMHFSRPKFDTSIRDPAIKNLICVCTVHPKLLMSEPVLKVLDRELTTGEVEIKHTIIHGLMEFFRSEDNKSQRKNRSDKIFSTDSKLDVAAFHGESSIFITDGICASLIQRYIYPVLDLCLWDSGVFSFLAVQFLQLVVKLGFANPKICTPTIIALESSTNPYIKKLATGLHTELYDRHESLTDSSYFEGIRLAVKYRKAISTNFYSERYFISSLYAIVRDNYSSRKKFFQSVIKLFRVDITETDDDKLIFNRDLTSYLAVNVSILNISTLEEVLLLIYNLDNIISTEGMDLWDEVKKEDLVSTNSKVRSLAYQCQTLIPIIQLRHHIASVYSLSPEDVERFQPNKVDVELRRSPKVRNLISFNPDIGEVNHSLDNTESLSASFTKFIQAINDFAN